MYRVQLVRYLGTSVITAALTLAADNPAETAAKVKALQGKILQLPADPPGPLRSAFFALGDQGPAARHALKALAMRPDLSTSHQAFAGGFLAEYDAFNPDALKALLKHPNPFVRMEAVVLLADLGGSANRRAIVEAGTASPVLHKSKTYAEALQQMPAKPRLDPVTLSNLNRMMNGTDSDEVATASAAMRMFHEVQPANARWALRKLIDLRVIGGGTAWLAGRALADFHKEDVDILGKFTARQNNRWLRFHAINALARSPEGKKILRRLLEQEYEPLRPQIEEALNK